VSASRQRQPDRGFTLLEVVIALVILTSSLIVLVQTQGLAVLMTAESERYLVATNLARQKMAEITLRLEEEGFIDRDVIEEQGDFDDLDDHWDGYDLDEAVEDYRWAYIIREIDLTMAADLGAMAEGMMGDAMPDGASSVDTPDLMDIPGMSDDMLGNMLNPYIREVRVVVWWGENEDELDQVDIVTHVINPTGVVGPDPEAQ
jgi:prepilin-type N-terminal cleavage/methylation domain-containing protein